MVIPIAWKKRFMQKDGRTLGLMRFWHRCTGDGFASNRQEICKIKKKTVLFSERLVKNKRVCPLVDWKKVL